MKCNSVFIVLTLLLAVSTLSIHMRMHVSYAYGSAVVWTDKPDYAPRETVTIFGSSFKPNTNIVLTITRPDLLVVMDSTVSDASGDFVYYYVLDGIVGTYTVNATDGTNTATTTFTDLGVDFKQYANKDDLWINSILQSSNSIYYECMSVPQRVISIDIASTSGDVHTLTLSHMATKGGIHAYDWLTGWNQGNVPPLSYTPWGPNIPSGYAGICQNLHLKTTPYEIFVDVPDDPFISKDGSTQARINAYEAAWGNRQIRICGNKPITSAGFSAISHDVANGGDTGDSFILYTLTWSSASDQILIEMAGHLAMSGNPTVNPIAWGVGLGSSQIAGGPYHFKLDELDGHSLGSQDNQIMGADILISPGHIIVHKTTVPSPDATAIDFEFDPDYQEANFFLADGEQYDSGALVPGTYHLQELVPSGWDLTGLTVTDPDLGSSVNLGTGMATIDLDAGETVQVYFTSTQRGRIIVDKITVPTHSSQTFTFTTTGIGYSGFSLTDDAAPNDSGWLVPGTYAVTEAAVTGWNLASVTLDGVPSLNGASISLAAGQIRYVNFTDAKSVPVLYTVTFYTIPNNIGASITFDSTTYMDGQSGKYTAGPYAVVANAPAGWSFDYWETSGGVTISSPAQVNGDGTITAAFIQNAPSQCTICDFVWKDLDRDGVQDVGEPGFPSVTVKLCDSLDNLVATSMTDGNGLCSFTRDPGSYYLEFVPPSGYVLSVQDQGTDDTKDSDPNPTSHKTAIFFVISGQTDSTRDAGMYAIAPPPPVGGEWVPVARFSLLAPWISLGSVTALITASFVYVKRKKKQMG